MFRTLNARPTSLRVAGARPSVGRNTLVCKAFKEGESAPQTTTTSVNAPSWLPEQAKPVLDFLQAEDVKLSTVTDPIKNSDLYKQYAVSFVESPVAKEALGWQKLPEVINGRLAMLGFVAGALAEIFGAGSLLQQFAGAPQAVVITIGLFTAASIIPIVKATQGDYLASLRDTYSIPEGVFTEANEKLHGRVAMLGLFSLLLIEVVIGHALL